MSVHRTLEGDWAECPAPVACELLFHLPELTVAEAEAMPLGPLLSLLSVVDPPSEVFADGSMYWYDTDGALHRDYDLPAVIEAGGEYGWYLHGQSHRLGDKPAAIRADGLQEWWVNGGLHRDGDKPAYASLQGDKEWWVNGELHRDGDKPAIVGSSGKREWYNRGVLHREVGPAVVTPPEDADVEFWQAQWWLQGKVQRVTRAEELRPEWLEIRP